ncbi:CRTAC1 family protein [Flagellimonas algicola]|uniref:CRTAC1 family protein n=1 Tax=Flagellimonas algicola TaxID=2583815 RepID=A0ABY2WLR9_9FLAO|nr:CRTAC1 family protein [Allomuricauda algicola]TMU55547.1 CRTAC1 family protein [Allomuricauda algicola]
MSPNLKLLLAVSFPLLLMGCAEKPEEIKTEHSLSIFEEITEGRIATDGGLSRGVAWGDYDGDGDPDLYVSNSSGQWNALYRNNGDGTFKKMTEGGFDIKVFSELVRHGGSAQGANWVDYDNDGDLDLYVVGRDDEPNFLFNNIDNLGFTRITEHPLTEEGIRASMACWADIEGDGDLDIFIVASGKGPNRVYKNLGDGNFEFMEEHLLSEGTGRARACACGDANGDALPEFYIANAQAANDYYVNLGNWEFQKVEKGHLVQDVGYSYGVSWADYDDDGDLDLFLANFDKMNFLYNNDGSGNLSPVMEGPVSQQMGGASKGHTWGDYDNDGDLDLYVANGTYRPEMFNFFYLNKGDGSFEQDFSGHLLKHADTSAGAAHADFDRDGDLDIFVANWGSSDQVNRFYKNSTTGSHWISLRLNGTQSNRFGIGAKISLFSNEKIQYRWMYPVTGYASQNDYELHFGLGQSTVIDSLKIEWPSGHTDVHPNPTIDTHFSATEAGALEIKP